MGLMGPSACAVVLWIIELRSASHPGALRTYLTPLFYLFNFWHDRCPDPVPYQRTQDLRELKLQGKLVFLRSS
jgi:hypothetical protein